MAIATGTNLLALFNNNTTDATGNHTINNNNSCTFETGWKAEGTHSVQMDAATMNCKTSSAVASAIKTLEFYVYITSQSSGYYLYGIDGSNMQVQWYGGKIWWTITGTAWQNSVSVSATTQTHLAWTFDETDIKFFKDGVEEESVINSEVPTNRVHRIGNSYSDNSALHCNYDVWRLSTIVQGTIPTVDPPDAEHKIKLTKGAFSRGRFSKGDFK